MLNGNIIYVLDKSNSCGSMNMKLAQLIVALTAVVLLASVPYVAAQGSGIEYQYTTGIVNLCLDDYWRQNETLIFDNTHLYIW